MSQEIDATKFTKIPISQVTIVPDKSGNYTLIKNYWWAVTEDDCILIYKKFSKQCNANEEVVKHIVACENYPKSKAVFLENVFLPSIGEKI